MMKSNFHTHSILCDGNDTPAVMAAAAVEKGLTRLGFTGHSFLPFDPCGMTVEQETNYRAAVLAALDRLAEDKAVFEINTGAIARGYRKTPYPSRWILEEIRKRDCGIVINSDCHNAPHLDFAYAEAVKLAKAAGFPHQLCFDGKSFVPAEF